MVQVSIQKLKVRLLYSNILGLESTLHCSGHETSTDHGGATSRAEFHSQSFPCVFQFLKRIPTVLQRARAPHSFMKNNSLARLVFSFGAIKVASEISSCRARWRFRAFCTFNAKRAWEMILWMNQKRPEREDEKKGNYSSAQRGVQKEPPTCVPQFWCSRRTYCGIFML
jgi:hypothetical protein